MIYYSSMFKGDGDWVDEGSEDEIFWWFFWRTNKSTLEKMKTDYFSYGGMSNEWDYVQGKMFIEWRNKMIDEDKVEKNTFFDDNDILFD